LPYWLFILKIEGPLEEAVEYRIQLDNNRGYLWVSTSGQATSKLLKELITELLRPPYVDLSYDVLFDISSLDMSPLSSNDIREIRDMIVAEKENIMPVKHAIVASSAITFGMARMFQLISEDALPMNMRVYRHVGEALAWLNSDRPIN
jgi:hypothetical protein